MKKFTHIFYICLILALICAFVMYKPEPKIKTVEVIKTIEKPVYRDYSSIDCCIPLKHYDNDKMIMQYDIKKQSTKFTDLNIRWQLYDRKGEQEINIPVSQSGNFKLYAGIGIGAVAVSGLVYLIK